MLTEWSARAGPIGLARILLGAGAGLTSFEGAALAHQLTGDTITTPVLDWLPRVTPDFVVAWFLLMSVASMGLLVGFASGTSAATLAVGNTVLLLADHQLYSNHRYLMVLLCVWFLFARADRAWAPRSARLRSRHGPLVPWWPQLLIVATVSSCYLFAGLSKLNPEFLSGATLGPLTPYWVPAQPAAWATPVTEVLIAVSLWFRRARVLVIVLGLLLHGSIVVSMGSPLVFGAFGLLCMSAYPLAGLGRVADHTSAEVHKSGPSAVVHGARG